MIQPDTHMKKLLLLFNALLFTVLQLHAQCSETDETKVMVIGDSWANFIGLDQVINTSLEKWGHSNYKYFTNSILAENGTETTDFLQPAKLNEIANQLNSHPEIEIVHLSLGGNDVLNQWHTSWSPAQTDSLLDSLYNRLVTIIDFIKVTKPGVKILWSGYAYPNFGEIIEDMAPFQSSHPFYATWSGMGEPDFLEINTLLNFFSDTISALAAADPQVDFIPATGLMQYAFGQPTNLGVPPGGSYAINTAPMPEGFPDYPSPKNSMRTYIIFRDCFHLSPEGYGQLLEYHTRKFYQKALMDDQYLLSEGGTRDGSVSSQGAVSNTLLLGESGSEEFSTIISFNTTVMPDTGASKASIFLRRESLAGTNPVGTTIQVTIAPGFFGVTADVEAADYGAPGNASDVACRFGSDTDDGHWIRLDLPESLLPYITNDTITQFIISISASTGGLITFSDASDPEHAPVLNLTYGPVTVGLAENSISNDLKIYPNPTRGPLFIEIAEQELQQVELFDLPGKTLLNSHDKTNQLDISSLPAGVYVLKVTTVNGIATKKIIKR